MLCPYPSHKTNPPAGNIYSFSKFDNTEWSSSLFLACFTYVWKSPDNDNVRISKRRSSSLLKLLPKFACLNNSLNIYNLPIIKQSASLSLHFPVQLRFFFRMNLCLLRFLSSSRATVKIRSHVLPTDLDTMRNHLNLNYTQLYPIPFPTTAAAAGP